jgi:hypothetical protein
MKKNKPFVEGQILDYNDTKYNKLEIDSVYYRDYHPNYFYKINSLHFETNQWRWMGIFSHDEIIKLIDGDLRFY